MEIPTVLRIYLLFHLLVKRKQKRKPSSGNTLEGSQILDIALRVASYELGGNRAVMWLEVTLALKLIFSDNFS